MKTPTWIILHEHQVLVDAAGSYQLALPPDLLHRQGEGILISKATIPPVWALRLAAPVDLSGYQWWGLRQFLEAPSAFSQLSRASQLTRYREDHRFCSACGAATAYLQSEHAIRCHACSRIWYPRLAPAIMVLIKRGDAVLLIRSRHYATGMFSTIAGFVEPGESLEEAVRRETMEETGVDLANIRYLGSQSWPFPHNLMIGFVADYAGRHLRVDGVEVEAAGWFPINQLPLLPPQGTLSRALIEAARTA